MILIGRGRIVAQGDKQSLLARDGSVSTIASALDMEALGKALRQEGYTATPEGDGLRVAGDPADVGRAALEHSVVLTELRNGAAGLEDLFLELTSDTQRDAHRQERQHEHRRPARQARRRPQPRTIDLSNDQRVPLGRLVSVESRKSSTPAPVAGSPSRSSAWWSWRPRSASSPSPTATRPTSTCWA